MSYSKIIVNPKKMTLSELRKTLKISQSALGTALGVHRNTIAQWELGINEISLTVNQIQVLEHLLNKIKKTFNDLETHPCNRNKKPLQRELCKAS
jgi:transcriptional regulator with XRE-family HTH domain